MAVPRVVGPLAGPPDLTLRLPGSRSHTNRALMCAGLASGASRLRGALRSDDTEAMVDCLVELGAEVVEDSADAVVTVRGVDGRITGGRVDLYTRLSGTTSRFVLAATILGEGDYHLDAAAPMRARPMTDGVDALRQLGATVGGDGEHLPLTVSTGDLDDRRRGGRVTLAGSASSQFVSGFLLVAPCLSEGLRIDVVGELKSQPYVDMTIATMACFGAEVTRRAGGFDVAGSGYRSADVQIEPDASSAAYLFAAAALTGGRVGVEGLDRESIQGDVGFVDVLGEMGASVTAEAGVLSVRGPRDGGLRGVDVDLSDMSDQAPTLGVLAAFAQGETRVRGIGFIRRKESDRIAATVAELRRLGADADEEPDGFVVRGDGGSRLHGGIVATYDDHRIAMSFALAGLGVPGVSIADPSCVAKTFPDFFGYLDRLRSTNG